MALHAHHRRGGCSLDKYRRQGEKLTLRLGVLKQHRQSRLLRFLVDPDIPPMNNAAERSMRPVVIARKVSQCSKSVLRAETYMRIKSTVETARLRGHVLISLRH